MNRKLILVLMTGALLLSACSNLAPTRPTNTRTIEVDVPEGIKNAEADAAIDREAPRTISLRRDGWFIGIYQVSSGSKRSHLEDELKKRMAERPGNQIYLKADGGIEFGEVVSALDVARGVGIKSAALIVRPQTKNALHRLTVDLPLLMDPNAPLEKPNPLTLEVRVTGEGILSLNREPQGTIDEPKLATTIGNVLQNRTSNMDKTVTVKGTRTSKYAIIVRVIDALKGAGAAPVVLQLDDLAEK
jgi:biopolymer transport protein ExbD